MGKMKIFDAIIFDWVGTLYQFGARGLFPYTERVLQELKPRYKLAVISKAVSDDVRLRASQIHEIGHYFNVSIVDVDKTSSQFKSCIKELRTTSERTLVVDDRVDRGIQIGNQLGCKTAWIQQGRHEWKLPNSETGEPTYKINSVEDLLKIPGILNY